MRPKNNRAQQKQRLATLLRLAEFSVTDLHKALGVSKGSASQYLSGKALPRLATLVSLSHLLQIGIGELTAYIVLGGRVEVK